MEMKLLDLDVADSYGRIYPTDVVEAMIRDANAQGGVVPGQLRTSWPTRELLNEDNLSHTVTDLRIENGALFGKVTINLNSADGQKLEMFKDLVMYRPRGYGVQNDKGEIVDFRLVCIDAVAEPSEKA